MTPNSLARYQLLIGQGGGKQVEGRRGNQELHFGYIKFEKPSGDLSRDAK